MQYLLLNQIGHFQVAFCLCVKTSRNHSYGNVFPLQVHFHAYQTHFHERFFTRTRFETEAQVNLEMAYLLLRIDVLYFKPVKFIKPTGLKSTGLTKGDAWFGALLTFTYEVHCISWTKNWMTLQWPLTCNSPCPARASVSTVSFLFCSCWKISRK